VAMSTLTISTNWSGYAVQTDLYDPQIGAVTAVSGSWVVPAARGRGTAFSSIWVGIDGYTSGTVQQIGTDSDVINGQPIYYVWYEMYPRPAVIVNSVTVRPGDTPRLHAWHQAWHLPSPHLQRSAYARVYRRRFTQ